MKNLLLSGLSSIEVCHDAFWYDEKKIHWQPLCCLSNKFAKTTWAPRLEHSKGEDNHSSFISAWIHTISALKKSFHDLNTG